MDAGLDDRPHERATAGPRRLSRRAIAEPGPQGAVPESRMLIVERPIPERRRGFRFVKPTIIYAHMQAPGMVNDHTVECSRWAELGGRRPRFG